MVKRSKKSKSKRVSLKKKYKIIKKVKEHHKKKAKEAKKLGNRKPKVEKDPGIPNAWPFREQELQALEERRARALKELEEKKQAKKERAQKRKLGLVDENEESALLQLAQDAEARKKAFDRNLTRIGESGSDVHDGSKKAFYKELRKVVEASDVIIQVLDARDPLGTRCLDVERLAIKSGSTKRVVLLLNKIDLVPREVAEKWLNYLKEELPTVVFKCSTQKQKANLGHKGSKKTKVKEVLETSECLGAETLLQLLKNYCRNQDLKTAITVGVVGLPNVGKSSLINSLKRIRAVNTGSVPGITRTMQEVHLDKHVKLIDCPGIVLPNANNDSASLSLRNCVSIEKLEDPVSPVIEMLKLCPREKLMCIYKISEFQGPEDFLQNLALVHGKLKKGGLVDINAAAKMVLHDWNAGKIPHYTLPPVRESSINAEAAIVEAWSKEFSVDEAFKNGQSAVIRGLPSQAEINSLELPSGAPMAMDDDLQASSEDEMPEANAMPSCTGMDEMIVDPLKTCASGGQNAKLYDAEGIFNPHKARANRKRVKKLSSSRQLTDEDMDKPYDFNVDYEDAGNADLEDVENDNEPMMEVEH